MNLKEEITQPSQEEPMCCPKCSSEALKAGEFDYEAGGAVIRDVECKACGFEWTEVFTFQSWYPAE